MSIIEFKGHYFRSPANALEDAVLSAWVNYLKNRDKPKPFKTWDLLRSSDWTIEIDYCDDSTSVHYVCPSNGDTMILFSGPAGMRDWEALMAIPEERLQGDIVRAVDFFLIECQPQSEDGMRRVESIVDFWQMDADFVS